MHVPNPDLDLENKEIWIFPFNISIWIRTLLMEVDGNRYSH